MPKQAAALFSQIEGLLEQVMDLEYDTEAKSMAEGMLSQVRDTLPKLRERGAEEEAPMEESDDLIESESPMKHDSRAGWKAARENAKQKFGETKASEDEEAQSEDEDDETKAKKRKKVPSY